MSESSRNEAPEEWSYVLYHYTPALPASIAALAIFAILTALHIGRLIQHRARYFIAFTVGGICSHFNEKNVLPFAMQNSYILLAPALYAASLYMILGRLIRTCRAEKLSLIPVNQITRIFVRRDIVAFSIQASGGSMAMTSYKLFKVGEKVVITGLFVQAIIFVFFMFTAIVFHQRMFKNPIDMTLQEAIPWRRHLYVLYSTSGIILLRSVFRIVEFIQGNGGYLIKHEAFLYVFDTLLMASVMAIFLIWYIDGLESKKQTTFFASILQSFVQKVFIPCKKK
ncbi:RTA1 protein [Dactylonectria macrodidyma]|uniref:RTA1 protein n=1 Tax=Dactylonectria macrodidyma TaxID=307937 RepID=A0A9P9JIX2_9HYPO|nr:RTA1 protein [Dactylonectria macrodidyma]